jgi:hypothetical protein
MGDMPLGKRNRKINSNYVPCLLEAASARMLIKTWDSVKAYLNSKTD